MSLKSSSKNNLRNPLTGIKIIALVGVSSMLLTNAVIAQDLNSVTKVPTTYSASNLSYAPTREIPAGYVKGNYKAVSLKAKNAKKISSPAANELSLQEAAEIAAQELYRLFNVKLTNQTLNMYYTPKSNDEGSSWFIDLMVTPDYVFMIHMDATTGELNNIICQGSSDVKKLSASEDTKTIKNGMAIAEKGLADPDAACAKVKTLVTERGFISEPIESITYVDTSYNTACLVAHPYSQITHVFNITTTSKKSYDISTTDDLTGVFTFYKK